MIHKYQVVCHIYPENSSKSKEIYIFNDVEAENESEALQNVVKMLRERCKSLGVTIAIAENYEGEYDDWIDTWQNETMEIIIAFPFGSHKIKGFYITEIDTDIEEE